MTDDKLIYGRDRGVPCDNLPCMNLIPYDEVKKFLDDYKQKNNKDFCGLIMCGHCEDSPPPNENLKALCDMSFDDTLDVLREVLDAKD